MAKRLIAILFIGLVGVFMMSHNASAAELNMPVVYNRDLTSIGSDSRCAVQNGPFVSLNGNTCVWGTNVGGDLQGRGLAFFETGYAALTYTMYYEIYLTVGMTSEAQLMIPVIWSPRTTSNFHLVSFEQVNLNENIGSSATNETYTATYRFILKPVNSGWQRLQLGDDNRLNNFIYLGGDPWSVVVDTRVESIMEWKVTDDSASTTQIVNAINQLKQSQEAQNAKEEQATENIENQSPSDMQVGSDSSAQSLIGTLSSFLSYITNLQATNCNVSLPFPSYAGGTQTFNVCQGKDKAGNIVSIFSSLTLFVFYLPVAFKLLGIIYSEIRSFTNG